MTLFQLLVLAVALSMDAFAVSIGSCTRSMAHFRRHALISSLSFGFFQAAMPVLGWNLGRIGALFLDRIDHWVAFVLLAGIGGKMIWEGWHHEANCPETPVAFSWKTLLTLSVATSIDAAAVGVSLSLLQAPILLPALIIGVVTFFISWLGHQFGRFLGYRFGKGAEVVGGLVLIAVGLRILFIHMHS